MISKFEVPNPSQTRENFDLFIDTIEANPDYKRPEMVSFSSPDGNIVTAGINHRGTPAALAMATDRQNGVPTSEFFLDQRGIHEVLTWLGKHNVEVRNDHPTAEALKASSMVLVRVVSSKIGIASIVNPEYRKYWEEIYTDTYKWCQNEGTIMESDKPSTTIVE